MAYKIIDIQGIGPAYAEKLSAAGITTVDQLLEMGKTAKARKSLEETTGINGSLILTWVNHADLFRVKGIGPQFAELLEAAGVTLFGKKSLCKREVCRQSGSKDD